MVIKPARDGGPAAVARLGNYMDLGWYARALAEREAAIPARVLSQPLIQQAAGSPIPLPLEPPPHFVAEPFVDIARWQSPHLVACPCFLHAGTTADVCTPAP